MKKIRFLFMVLLIPFLGMAQTPTGTTTGHTQYKGKVGADSGIVNTLTDTFSRTQPIGTERLIKADSNKYVWLGNYWKKLTGNASGGSTYTFTSPLSNSGGVVSIDLSNYATTSALTSGLATKQNTLGYTAESTSNKTIDANGTSNSLYPTQGAVKAYVDAKVAAVPSFDSNSLNLTTRFNAKQDALGFTPYNATNPAGYISSVPAQSFSSLTGKPTTLLGYGITDAYPLSGNPSGFLTSYTETDPTFNTKFAAKSTSDLAEGTNKYYTDAKVQAVIDADTGRGVGNLTTGGTLKKVSDSLAALIGGGGVSVASAAEVNTGTDNAKFASPLAIEGSKYLDQDGSKIAGLTTGTSTAYVLNTTPSFTPGTWTMLNVKFHVTNTGAATINVNGSGAVPLQKDLSTALVANDIPANSEYQILRTSTGYLIKDIGLAGVTTGTGLPVRQTTATLITPVLGVATATSINKVAFTSPATAATLTLANGSTLATAGAFSTTLTATATTNITLPTTGTVATLAGTENLTNKSFPSLSSGTTNDSILVADPSTGAVRRISSARIASAGGTDATAWHKGGDNIGSAMSFGSNDPFDVIGKVNNIPLFRLTSATSVVLGEYGTMIGASNVGMGYQTFINGASSFAMGTLAKSVGTSVFSFGWQADNSANHSMLFNCSGSTATNTTTNQAKFVVPNGLVVTSTLRGSLISPLTTSAINSIATPETGHQAYDTDLKHQKHYDGTAWRHSPNVYIGTAAPATTPLMVGDLFVDTTGKKIYCATGTASSADWTILN